ncbi:MAG: response regulator [Betaproteobacteria bacterium]
MVDDDMVTRKLLERLLMMEGYPVRVAGNRNEFIAALKLAPQPSLILLDVNLPDMNGFEVLPRLRQHAATGKVPVVMLTSCATPDDVARAFKLGADGYLSKPVKVGVVRRLLTEIYGTR